LAPIRYHQLFFDRMKYRRASGPVYVHDRRGRPRKTAPPPAGPPHVGWIQPPLVAVSRDYTRIVDSTAYTTARRGRGWPGPGIWPTAAARPAAGIQRCAPASTGS
jgi:hypothetical protein